MRCQHQVEDKAIAAFNVRGMLDSNDMLVELSRHIGQGATVRHVAASSYEQFVLKVACTIPPATPRIVIPTRKLIPTPSYPNPIGTMDLVPPSHLLPTIPTPWAQWIWSRQRATQASTLLVTSA